MESPRVRLVEGDLRDQAPVGRLFAEEDFDVVVHLAARAGVRPSIAQAPLYHDLNVRGTQVLLDALCAAAPETRFVLASSSSVYGAAEGPFREDQRLGRPLSPYAASKHASELVAHVMHHLHGLPTSVLRFFTAYGPRQRPDMAVPRFARRLLHGEPVRMFGDGSSVRDYTFVGDVVRGVVAAMERTTSDFQTYNLGCGRITRLDEFVAAVADVLGVPLLVERLPDQPGDVPLTLADVSKAKAMLGWEPTVPVVEGLRRSAPWLLENCSRETPGGEWNLAAPLQS